MSKIAVIGDMHIGVRGGNENFLKFQLQWLRESLQAMKREGVKAVVQVGDFFDVRKQTNNLVLYYIMREFVPLIREFGIPWTILVGNHDIYYRHSNEVYTTELLQQLCPDLIRVYSRFDTIKLAGHDVFICPWLDKENMEALGDAIDRTDAKIAFGHLDLEGFQMYKGIVSEHGLSPTLFKKFDRVVTGHFHTVSESANISYTGSPYHLNWLDYADGEERGWFLFDLEKNEFTLMRNEPWMTLFGHFVYDENYDYDEHDGQFLDEFDGMIVKVIVKEKTNKRKFESFRSRLNSMNLISYDIIDETVKKSDDNENITMSSEVLERGTLDSIVDYIDQSETDINKGRLKEKAVTLFTAAMNLGA